jgi:hypothetical protein
MEQFCRQQGVVCIGIYHLFSSLHCGEKEGGWVGHGLQDVEQNGCTAVLLMPAGMVWQVVGA